jgi:hypothetical protein
MVTHYPLVETNFKGERTMRTKIGEVDVHGDGSLIADHYMDDHILVEFFYCCLEGSLFPRHRHYIGGPAVCDTRTDYIMWVVHGVSYSATLEYCKACGFDEETTMVWVLKYGDELPQYHNQL